MQFEEIKTPCYILDENDFVNNINNFKKSLEDRFDSYIVAYSFKTNSLPRILKIVSDNGCFAEVVSDDEYELAKRLGFESDRIIFNGPVKSRELFLEAVRGNSIVNIDSKRELTWIKEELCGESVKIGIRVNFDLESKLPGQTSTGVNGGRFGFSYENGELSDAIREIKNSGNIISGLHMHVSNASKSVDVYEELARMACEIVKKENLELSYIDFGGGYFGGGDNGEAYDRYVKAISKILSAEKLTNITVIVEPGASVVATSFKYVTTVIDVKDTSYGRFVITDGTRLHLDFQMHKEKYKYSLVTDSSAAYPKQVICGYTCMENDRIMTLEGSPELSVGDKVIYDITGSYTMCFAPLFISYLPRVYSSNMDKTVLVRDKWSVDEYIMKNRWDI